jgi:hypothetical protein
MGMTDGNDSRKGENQPERNGKGFAPELIGQNDAPATLLANSPYPADINPKKF